MKDLYKILLVDDEDEIRGRIASLIEDQSGFQVVGKAGNGSDAYELIEDLKPDVVLTDIKMPFIDGIELARLLKRDYPTVKVAFISGYDDFKYAQEAIHLNVIGYLMKPVKSEDINFFLTDLKGKLDEEYARKFNIEAALKHYEDSLPLIIDHLLSNLLITNEISEEALERLSRYGLEVTDGVYASCLIEIESFSEDIELIALEKVKVLLLEMLSTNFSEYALTYTFMVQDGLFLIIKEHKKPILREMDAFLYELLQSAEQYMDMRLRVGISSVFREFKHIAKSYNEAKKALGYGKFLNTGRIVYLHEVEKKEAHVVGLSLDDIKQIETTIRFGTIEEINVLFEKRKTLLKATQSVWVNPVPLIISLANIILTFSQSINAMTSDIIEPNILDKMLGMSDVDLLFDWSKQKLIALRERNIENNVSRTEKMLYDALDYVEKFYSDPTLSLNTVCDYLDISISYLSMLLKREKNITFNKHVVQVRMEKAKELLAHTNHKIIDISIMVGYNEVYYFSHSFKKYTGESPKHFREKPHV